jgi:hypothetical protein
MKKKEQLKSYFKTADIYASRLKSGLENIEPYLPLDKTKIANFAITELAVLDLIVDKFAKLQDIIGAKIFPLILAEEGEDALSLKDRLNKLEKLEIIDDANWWMDMRELINRVIHEYPEHEDIVAMNLNAIIPEIKKLLDYYQTLRITKS